MPQLLRTGSLICERLPKIGLVKRGDLIEGDGVHAVIEVCVDCAGDEQELFVVAFELGEGVLSHIAGVRGFPVYDKHGASDLIAVAQKLTVKE